MTDDVERLAARLEALAQGSAIVASMDSGWDEIGLVNPDTRTPLAGPALREELAGLGPRQLRGVERTARNLERLLAERERTAADVLVEEVSPGHLARRQREELEAAVAKYGTRRGGSPEADDDGASHYRNALGECPCDSAGCPLGGSR